MAITEEEKIRRIKIIEKTFNIVGAGYGKEISPVVRKAPYWEQYIIGDITLEELNKAVHNDIASN
ncbi:hypothetical protein [Anaeroplasma bactoclasticum]|jgi:hypothetical protein|nr:hypothetical protein [Anaeroplasma bactoclasticum]